MKKNKISYDELVAGLLLKFGSIDVNDISIIMDMMEIENFSSVNESGLGKYIIRNDNNRFEFNIDMIKRCYESMDEFYLVVRHFQSNVVRKFLNDLDLFEFILRKIRMLGNVKIDDYSNNFSDIQKFVIKELKNQRYLIDYWDEIEIDCKFMKLTMMGNLYLFLIDNKIMVDKFSKKLKKLGYDESLMNSFLIAQRLDMDIEYIEGYIMTVDNFLEFCNVYEINPYALDSGISENKGEYRRLKVLSK